MFVKKISLLIFVFITILSNVSLSQHSVARKWNEALLDGIRNDYARPTVHSRNLFHTSIAMYDAWAAFEKNSERYLLGKTLNGYRCNYTGIAEPADKIAAQEEAISFACYRLMKHRFAKAPQALTILTIINNLMLDLGYDKDLTSVDYSTGSPAALGNYIAQSIIEYGLMDGSNEINAYANKYYQPINDPLIVINSGNSTCTNPNSWQPLTLEVFIDQSGNEIPGATPPFLGPEWGNVFPFALNDADLTVYERNGDQYKVYHDPGTPPLIQSDGSGLSDEYKWTFSLVSKWSSHLDPSDGVMWDISPGASGNIGSIDNFPIALADYKNFYNTLEGGDPGKGRAVNPKTGQPYPANIVPRGDYTRVLAEFWADGPSSETPPGHWFTILNYVNDQPSLIKKYKGEGEVLSDLEWDIKSYFTLAGTMHDAAVTAWGIKGWYDYIRPVSAIRYMADQGQSSDPNLANYSIEGITLEPGYIELVKTGDLLAGSNDENVGKIKVYAWKGPDYINDPAIDEAGVDWILAENWWPYQRPSFITPPFAGYISGHSTFSRAAAEVLTLLTNDPFFPGGVGEFIAKKNEFLVFEEGPSQDVVLQWATYNDASDQTSLSRIWGGIHPPADDIRGRIIGEKIARESFALAEKYFSKLVTSTENEILTNISMYPNPTKDKIIIDSHNLFDQNIDLEVFDLQGRTILKNSYPIGTASININTTNIDNGIYILKIEGSKYKTSKKIVINH